MAKVVKATDLRVARRGRRAVRNEEILAAMAALQPGDALILDEFGEVSDDERSRVYQAVKAHWEDAQEGPCRISFDPETRFVQVEHKPAKGKAKGTK